MDIIFLSMFFIAAYMNQLGLINASWYVLIKPLIWWICWIIISEAISAFLVENEGGDDNNE